MSGFDKWELYNGLITPSSEYSEELKHGIMEIQHFLSSYCSIKDNCRKICNQKIYKCPGNISVKFKGCRNKQDILSLFSWEVSLYKSFSHPTVRDINKRLVWKCIDSERRVRIKHCAKLTKRVLFERGSGVLFIVGVHRIRISIWISTPSAEVKCMWRGWEGQVEVENARGAQYQLLLSAFVLGCKQMLSDFMIKCGKWKMWKSWCAIKIGQSWPSLILA